MVNFTSFNDLKRYEENQRLVWGVIVMFLIPTITNTQYLEEHFEFFENLYFWIFKEQFKIVIVCFRSRHVQPSRLHLLLSGRNLKIGSQSFEIRKIRKNIRIIRQRRIKSDRRSSRARSWNDRSRSWRCRHLQSALC